MLEVVRTLLPAASLGHNCFCFLFGAQTTAVLQRAVSALHEHRRRTKLDILYRLRGSLPLPDSCAPPTPSPAELAEISVAVELVAAMVSLLQSGAHNAVWAQVSVEQKPFIAWFVEEHCKVVAHCTAPDMLHATHYLPLTIYYALLATQY